MDNVCAHFGCDEPGEYVRGQFRFCFGHWLVVLMREQPVADREDEVAS